jgi:2-polyprenyl-3-methyl-5-hydroxy-6-metoxy-1,4-benzoquinol methylase
MASDEKPTLDSEIIAHYESMDEAQRLHKPESEIERLRTQELLQRYFPPPPAVILDIGAGAGVYAFWLADRGYQVHLVDAVPLHVSQAEEAARQKGAHRSPASAWVMPGSSITRGAPSTGCCS